ncbi:PorP/SprF family type IX secretion system membrane protein [Deminuibacter soli]|uniref:Type IX secretion system membrane protein PorP/SprF n=1 Tax=Deminuibacter soli TaxID=2291815 RepID=A0A3E1NFX1_9BACT|nr:type IX secretion system membrane protein PorP/SprF [Deminuibacter soli]RFM26866.1 type IX secretion system membrane protein PorP/SprF [Deminuibacter soli]
MQTKILILVLVLLCNRFTALAQQDIQFSQYIFNMVNINPAYAGYKGGTNINAIYRKQWTGFPGSPQTAAVSADWLTAHRDERIALSVRVLSDKLGAQETLSAWGGFTYRIPMSEDGSKRLCLGLGMGVTQYSIDGNVFQYTDNNDNTIPVGKASRTQPDANAGIYYYTPNYYFSVSVSDILQVNSIKTYNWNGAVFRSMLRSPHLYVGTGTVIPVSDNFKIKPSFMWKEDFKGPSNVDLTAFVLLHDVLWLGASYRTAVRIWNKSHLQDNLEQKDAVSAMAEVFATPWLRIGYSYDFTTSGLNSYQTGSHEISVSLLFPANGKRELSPRYF